MFHPLVLAGLLAALLAPVSAHESPTMYNRVNLSETASGEVANDTLVAVLFVQKEGRDASELANEVNTTIRDAVTLAKQLPDIDVQTLNYHTNAVYNDGKVSGWRVRQSIRLESLDSESLGGLIGELQQSLAVQSLTYEVSDDQRRTAIQALTNEALIRFEERATAIATALGRKRYDLVRLSINDGATGGQPYMRAMAMDAMVEKAAPVHIESGTQDLRVTVSGEIELSTD